MALRLHQHPAEDQITFASLGSALMLTGKTRKGMPMAARVIAAIFGAKLASRAPAPFASTPPL